eukprot:TRINITY_DN55429_c0_g1_i2.p1 TRINITY_DN55429_c0_g1~~TRINITY_DN55429_c0_g1_i2.p1  ORF type:complete len:340 (+),score=54.68 TRINITY_DN55429_c0_g1_i2:74-1093(+)
MDAALKGDDLHDLLCCAACTALTLAVQCYLLLRLRERACGGLRKLAVRAAALIRTPAPAQQRGGSPGRSATASASPSQPRQPPPQQDGRQRSSPAPPNAPDGLEGLPTPVLSPAMRTALSTDPPGRSTPLPGPARPRLLSPTPGSPAGASQPRGGFPAAWPRAAWVPRRSQARAPAASRPRSGGTADSPEGTRDSSPTSSAAAAEWQPDAQCDSCNRCRRSFTLTFRKHHCRGCGLIFCDDCSIWRCKVPGCGNQPARVCQNCHMQRRPLGRARSQVRLDARDASSARGPRGASPARRHGDLAFSLNDIQLATDCPESTSPQGLFAPGSSVIYAGPVDC